MIGRGEVWRARKLVMTRLISGAGAFMMALLLIYGLWQGIPDRNAVFALRRGEEALKRSNYAQAEKSYNAVLSLVPNSTVARLGLACAFYRSGERSAATIELTKALEAGAFAERLGRCGHGLQLSDVFFVAKLGLSDAFAVPRVADAKRFETALMEEPTGTTEEESDRMLLGACLAQRAGLAGAAWDYAGNALETGAVDDSDRARFFSCFGPQERRRAGCAGTPSLRACVLTPAARSAYFRDVRLVDLASQPAADR
jgi:tetratricopeptide (TPR) repeat protein